MHQSQRHEHGPSAPRREAQEASRLHAREKARRSIARRYGGVGLDYRWRPGRRRAPEKVGGDLGLVLAHRQH
jgi:hypothetical protein